jgi:hypothetical protein
VTFDASPAPSKIRISIRQAYDRMQMIRQNDDRIDRKRAFLPGHAKSFAKCTNVVDKNCRASILECECEEKGAASSRLRRYPTMEPL